MKKLTAVSDFKLRLGWGKTGQQDTGKEYYTAAYVHGTNNHYTYPVGPGNNGILYQPLTYNEDLTWETTTTYNIGLDFGLWNQRLTLTADAYKRKTTDLLCTPTIPAGQSFDNAMLLNAGELENTGVEVAVNAKLIQTRNWFVDGASKLAGRFGIPQLVIGLTIVAMGTSLPEAAVSITAALQPSIFGRLPAVR